MRRQRAGWDMLSVCLVMAVLALPVWAEEVTAKNDSLSEGDLGAIQAGFDPGESAAAWLTAPCAGDIVAVQVFWRSVTGGAPLSLEDSITIFSDGTFPTPGPVKDNLGQPAILVGPVMTDGGLNEFRFLNEAQTIPIQIPVTAGEVFVVSFKFYNDPDPFNGPSVVTDTDGCQDDKNAIAPPWTDACSLGISGDFVIRAIIECPDPTGACCHADGTCGNGVFEADCQAFGDVWYQDTDCSAITCTPRGACCMGSSCLTLVEPNSCVNIGGLYAGDGTDCNDDVCVLGACCIPETGECIENFGFECDALGGNYEGPGTSCDPNPCPQPPGACCFGYTCIAGQTQLQCLEATGVWGGAYTDCADLNEDGTADVCEDPCVGQERADCNGDGSINSLDIDPYVEALVDPDQFNMDYSPLTWECVADINCDGSMNSLDTDPFVECLTSGCAACP